MSWNAWGTVDSAEATESIELKDYTDKSPEAREQFQAAKGAAKSLIAAGVVGSAGRRFSVSLSGHANPDHGPAPGYANDCISISISQTS